MFLKQNLPSPLMGEGRVGVGLTALTSETRAHPTG